jgi:signal transduction histidine kinase
VAQKARKDSPALIGDAEDSQQLVQQLSQEIRTMSYLLHPPLLDEVGLSEALRWYTQGLMERSGLEITLTIADDFGRLPREKELVMFRLVQECLTNIHRHSGSRTAMIRVLRDAQSASLEVRDEGKGISPQKLAEMQTRGSGVGIRGMRERVLQFEGDMTIKSDEQGTTIFFTIPLGENSVAKPEKINEQLQTAG